MATHFSIFAWENARETWWATVHGTINESDTIQLLSMHIVADDTTLMAESEELKSLLMKVKESEKLA